MRKRSSFFTVVLYSFNTSCMAAELVDSSDAAEQLEALQKENDELKKKLEVSSSLLPRPQTAATHYGCSYFVPKSWEEDNSTEVEKYYYP